MTDDANPSENASGATAPDERADGADLIGAALDYLRGGLSSGRTTPGPSSFARQEACLLEWARGLGLVLTPDDLPSTVIRGGQEHNIYHDEKKDRYIKVTRNGVFGFSPGIELALVSSEDDARRFHLWEAMPLKYLERLSLQNDLVPGLNHLEGMMELPDGGIAIVISQPRFDLVPVTTPGIDAWFASLRFQKVTDAAYYRSEDNLGIFDAHDKNLVRAGDLLVPFDVIPCRPAGGFLAFIEDTLAAGHHLRAVRTVTTNGNTPGEEITPSAETAS
jgi:hypothetical protein